MLLGAEGLDQIETHPVDVLVVGVGGIVHWLLNTAMPAEVQFLPG
jgi:hypothetical protein